MNTGTGTEKVPRKNTGTETCVHRYSKKYLAGNLYSQVHVVQVQIQVQKKHLARTQVQEYVNTGTAKSTSQEHRYRYQGRDKSQNKFLAVSFIDAHQADHLD